ncbi:MAG: FadR/GntR family transcriptional regulator [Methyloligellaceae bacterium]
MTPSIENVFKNKTKNSHAHLVEEIGQDIVLGKYNPGSLIPTDNELEETYAMSRTVVREAKKTLGAKGLITSKAKVGTMVLPKTEWNMFDQDILRWHFAEGVQPEFISDLFDIRLIFEPSAAALAAQNATEEDKVSLRLIIEEFEESTHTHAQFAAIDLKLHKAILKASGNSFLNTLAGLIEAALFGVFKRTSPNRDQKRMLLVVEEHKRIVDAICAGNAKAAEKAMTSVIASGNENIKKLVSS